MKQIFRAIFFAVIFSYSCALSQGFVAISGVVTDSLSGNPIGGVVVTVIPEGKFVITDANGNYRIRQIFPGQISLQLESAFHRPMIIGPLLIRAGDDLQIDAALQPLVLNTRGQVVIAEREQATGLTIFSQKQLEISVAEDVGEFLRQQGYHIHSDGKSKEISLNGFSPDRILVLIDGNRINPNGGRADLATIPVATIARIEVYDSGAATRFGADALGGAVNLISKSFSKNMGGAIAVEQGSYGYVDYALDISTDRIPHLLLLGNYNYTEGKGDYGYQHPYLGEQIRVNNYRRQQSIYLSLRVDNTPNPRLTFRYYHQHNGLPGAIFQESPAAGGIRSGLLVDGQWQQGNLDITGSLSQLRQEFVDRSGFIRYDKDYLQIGRKLNLRHTFSLRYNLNFMAEGSYFAENLFGTDRINPTRSLPQISRRTASLFLELDRHFDLLFLTLLSKLQQRFDRVENRTYSSPHFGMVLTSNELFSPVELRIESNYSESFRLPPIDALFWQGDVFAVGNSDLYPETAHRYDLSFRTDFNFAARAMIEVKWFDSDVNGMIIWQPRFDGKYMPVNLDRVVNWGRDVTFAVRTKNDFLSLRYRNSKLDARNKTRSGNYYDKLIPFQPHRSEQIYVGLSRWQFRLDYRYSFVGSRFIRQANTKELSPYKLHDLVATIKLELFSLREEIELAVNNMGNTRYQLSERMPMPPRTYHLRLKFIL